jgi:hypothetical protein
MKNAVVAFLAVCAAFAAIAVGVMLSQDQPGPAVPVKPVQAVVAPEREASEEYWARLATLRQHAYALKDQITALEESNKQFDRPEYNPCLADAQGGVGRCVSEQASALESLHRLLTDAIVTDRDALMSTDQFRAWLIRQRKFQLAHGGDILPTNNMLQKVAKEGAAIQQALLESESTLDATDTKYIQAMLSGEVVNSKTPLQTVPETIRDPGKMHRCVEAIAAARTYRFPTAPAGSGSLSDEERRNQPGYWEEGQRVAGDWASMNAAVTAACGFRTSLWR